MKDHATILDLPPEERDRILAELGLTAEQFQARHLQQLRAAATSDSQPPSPIFNTQNWLEKL